MFLFLRSTSAWRLLRRFFRLSLHKTGPSPWISGTRTSTFLFIQFHTDFWVFSIRVVPSSIRFFLSVCGFPLGFYPFGCHAGQSPSLPGNSDSSLPRRLAYSSLVSGSPPVTFAGSTSVLPVSRLPDQLGEVLSSSFSGTELFGRGSGLSSSDRSSFGPSDRVTHPFDLPSGRLSLSSCSPLAAVSGAPCQPQGPGSGLSFHVPSSSDFISCATSVLFRTLRTF